jgi:hypothetical protein
MQNGMGKPKGIEAKDSSGGMLQYRKYWERIQFYLVGAGWWFVGEGLIFSPRRREVRAVGFCLCFGEPGAGAPG